MVLAAACLHAFWNALVKGGADKAAAMTAVVIGQGVSGLVLLPFVTFPDLASLPYLAGGVALHFGYQVFLIAAYRIGDLSQVYPIARGSSPLIVAAVSILVLGEEFAPMQLAGILLIALGIGSIALVRRSDGVFQGKAAVLALITGAFIASYSIVDGLGARVAGTALGFYAWHSLINAAVFAGVLGVVRPRLVPAALALRRSLVIGGGASFVAYALVMYAFTQAPIALVTALRETSIIFALFIGVGLFREPLNLAKVAATMMTLSGAALLRIYRG
jgi:drug/metabolite transporter (DMT)-like permease